jgi:arylsulfatase A-like enzyme
MSSGTGSTGQRLAAALLALGLLTATVALDPGLGEAAKKPAKKPGAKKKGKKKRKKPKRDERPNVVVLMTDDQEAASVRFMPALNELIAAKGTTFDNSFVNYSFCCPSRATFLTGQYAKNHGILSNELPQGGYQKLAPTVGNTLGSWLQNAGYWTAHVGHFVNGYLTKQVPPGWNEWFATLEGAGAYGYLVNDNGTIRQFGPNAATIDPPNYQTDVESARAAAAIRDAPGDKPFFLSLATFAPHTECACDNNPRAAPRHEGAFANEPLPKPPSYNEADVSDKPQVTSSQTPIPAFAEDQITKLYRNRLESLLAVDDMVRQVVAALSARGELDDTVFIFTSDNGFLFGEHRWRTGKVLPYEPSIRVPLIMRGPGIPAGAHRTQSVANVDLAPTILDIADAKPGRTQDGRSLLPLLAEDRLETSRGLLMEAYYNAAGEYGGDVRIVYRGVRTDHYKYVRYPTGEEELYDLDADPHELQSRHADPALAEVKASLDRLLGRLNSCAGESCLEAEGLRLRLRFAKGRRCTDSTVRAKVRGPLAGEIRGAASFFVNSRRSKTDSAAPYKAKFAKKQLSRRKRNRVVGNVTMLDGRELSLEREIPRRCASRAQRAGPRRSPTR